MRPRAALVLLAAPVLAASLVPAPAPASGSGAAELRPLRPPPRGSPEPSGTTSSRTLVVKLEEGTRVAAALRRLRSELPGAVVGPLFSSPADLLAAQRRRGEARSRRRLPDLGLYLRVVLPVGSETASALARLEGLEITEIAYPEPLPAPPPAAVAPPPAFAPAPPTEDLTPFQGYRTAAPDGVDSIYAAGVPGGLGENVRIIDDEYGFNPFHEDLPSVELVSGSSGTEFIDHGTAVLGELAAVENSFGVTGLAPQAAIGFVDGGAASADSINAAHEQLDAGDVLVLEAQTFINGSLGPVEWNPAQYDAIASATADGVIVVEAAGNGALDLDSETGPQPFPHGLPDSGAIIVGGGSNPECSLLGHRIRGATDYGARVDLHGYSECVTTTAGALGQNSAYTGSFNGTSAATAIVAGAAAVLSSIAKEGGDADGLSSPEVRSLMIGTGIPQVPPSETRHIGPMPNLRPAIEALTLSAAYVTSGPQQGGFTQETDAEFTFASFGGSGFECRFDSPEFSPCASPLTETGLGDGEHTFEVRTIEQAGSTPAGVRTFTVDTEPPETTIDEATTFSTDGEAEFAFSSADGAEFECSLDGGGFEPCISPRLYQGFSDGHGVFEVRAVDLAGNRDPSPAVAEFDVNSEPPETSLDSGPSGLVGSGDQAFTFSSEPGATFECRLDDGAFSACSSPQAYAALADGPHTFEVRALDAVGHHDPSPAASAFTVDTQPPETSIDSGPSGPSLADPQFEFSSEPGATFECRLDDGPFSPCSSPQAYAALADGPHTFEVRALDGVGNRDPSPAAAAFTVDTAAPQTILLDGPSGPTATAEPAFTFSSEPGATFECRLDDGPFSPCSSPQAYAALGDGPHTFEVRALDALGNRDPSPAAAGFVIDTVAPATEITSGPSGPIASADPEFTFGSEPGATFECRLDDGPFSPCSSPKAYSALADGPHSFEVRALDEAGNPDPTPAQAGFAVDTTAPQTGLLSGPDRLTSSGAPAFTFGSEPGARFECRLDGGAFSACSSPKAYAALADGPHTFEVRAIDGVGNRDPVPALSSFAVDTTSPETAIAVSRRRSGDLVRLRSSEPGAAFRCRVGGRRFRPCARTLLIRAAARRRVVAAYAIDAAGNRDPSPARSRLSPRPRGSGVRFRRGPA